MQAIYHLPLSQIRRDPVETICQRANSAADGAAVCATKLLSHSNDPLNSENSLSLKHHLNSFGSQL